VRVFKLVVAYDGTAFHGWQAQPGLRTVQGMLQDALTRTLGGPVAVHGAGRTDAGVHARGQVASFESGTNLPARALAPRLARLLPDDLRVRWAGEAPAGFHARHAARGRRYAYRLLAHDDVLLGRYAWHPRRLPSGDRLARAVAPLEGTHDLSAFRATGSSPSDPVCRVFHAGWCGWEGGFQFDMVADHFLYHMVRGVVGTALAAAEEPDPAAAMARVVASRERARTGVTAPAHGLCLEQVFYAEDAP
jgi:tRNA pseudouridine38-40 synthase